MDMDACVARIRKSEQLQERKENCMPSVAVWVASYKPYIARASLSESIHIQVVVVRASALLATSC